MSSLLSKISETTRLASLYYACFTATEGHAL